MENIKLFLWETVSTLLATLVFQAIPKDRGLLLDTFQFLALHGTRERKLVSPFQMMRHSSFTTVRKIAAGDYHLSDATTSQPEEQRKLTTSWLALRLESRPIQDFHDVLKN